MAINDITEGKSKKLSVSLSKRRIIRPLISNRFKLAQAIEALEFRDAKRSKNRGKRCIMNP